jgi:hypothetical protein
MHDCGRRRRHAALLVGFTDYLPLRLALRTAPVPLLPGFHVLQVGYWRAPRATQCSNRCGKDFK